jgi:hypothetical protein
MGAVAGALGSVVGAGASLMGSSSAAKAQTKAAQLAADTQMKMYQTTRGDLEPYRNLGSYGNATLANRLTELTSPITMDQATLEATPGYRFNLNAGLKAAQTSAAARGLGLSGAAIKGASTFATGLADNTYQNQFNNANTNQTNAFNRLLATTQMGANAAAQTGQAGTSAANGAAQAQIGAGNAQGAAAISGGNAIGTAANSLAQYYQLQPLYNKLLGSGGGGGSGGMYDTPGVANSIFGGIG